MKDAFEEALKKRAAAGKSASPALNIKIELDQGDADEEDKTSGLAPSKLAPKVPAEKAKLAADADEELLEDETLKVEPELDEEGNPIVEEEQDPNALDDADTLEQLAARAQDGMGTRKPSTLGERAAAEFLKKKK